MKNKNIRIALVFIFGAVLLYWGYNFLKGKDIFSNEKTFYAIYQDVSGLSGADPIYINGVQCGQVGKITFDAKDMSKVVVSMIYTKPQAIPSNSVAKIISTNLMGTKAISIQLGNSSIALEDGDTIRSAIESNLQEQVEKTVGPLKNKTEKLISSLEEIVGNLQGVLNNNTSKSISQSLHHLEKSLSNIAKLSGNLDKIVSNESKSIEDIFANVDAITSNLKDNNKHLSSIIQNFHQISDTLAQANIANTLQNTDQAMAHLSSILKKIDKGEGSLGLLLQDDSLYLELDKSANDLNELLEDIKKNPKRYVKFSLF